MRIVFIAGPYFGDGGPTTIERNIRAAEEYQIALANAQVGFFCPHTHTEHFQLKSVAPEEFYRTLDAEFLKRACDAMLVMPGWEQSKGAQAEVEWGKKNNIQMFFPKSPQDLD